MAVISKIIESHWDASFLVATVADDKGVSSTIRLSPAAQNELLQILLTVIPGTTVTTQLVLPSSGLQIAAVPQGHVLKFLMSKASAVQILVPHEALQMVQKMIAALTPSTQKQFRH